MFNSLFYYGYKNYNIVAINYSSQKELLSLIVLSCSNFITSELSPRLCSLPWTKSCCLFGALPTSASP